MKSSRQRREYLIQVRLTAGEMGKVEAMMESQGYRSRSAFVRDMLLKKKIWTRYNKECGTAEALRKRLNDCVYQINKIGVNYNQFVSQYNKQAARSRSDGTPAINTANTESTLNGLRILTERLRTEVALMFEYFKRYINENHQTTE